VKELLKLAPQTRLDEPIAAHCTMRVGGPARALVIPENAEELKGVLAYLDRYSIPFKIVGKGANLLVSDRGFDGALIILGQGFNTLERLDSTVVTAGAGMSLAALCARLARFSIAGFEFAAQIPGTVGGALVNNAGAFGQDWTERVVELRVVDAAGIERSMSKEELDLRYRSSSLKHKAGHCIVSATIAGMPGVEAAIREKILDYGRRRASSQPVDAFSAGCIFKNHQMGSAGQLIETAGLKGSAVGSAEVSSKHANFIINRGQARCTDVRSLIQKIKDRVYERFSVLLETEVEFVGEF
jgi:UDP-N-acetylmuramate dehydrogenase